MQELIDELADACTRLEDALSNLKVQDWGAAVQTRRGSVPVRQVSLQRWLDVEVHHVDLDLGYTAVNWPIQLVDAFLPAMIAMLSALRARPDADHSVNGCWVFRRSDHLSEWTVCAENSNAWQGISTEQPDVTLSGNGHDLLAVLLGRADVTLLDIAGSETHARCLKRPFQARRLTTPDGGAEPAGSVFPGEIFACPNGGVSATDEGEVGNAARGADGLDVEAMFELLQPVP
jgi:hypothetical protein